MIKYHPSKIFPLRVLVFSDSEGFNYSKGYCFDKKYGDVDDVDAIDV